MEKEVYLKIRNSLKSELTIYLEPWGEVYKVPANNIVSVFAKGPAPDDLEIEIGDSKITVYGWSGSIVSIVVSAET